MATFGGAGGASSSATTIVRPLWISQGVVTIPGIQHDLLKSPDKFLPKFDPDMKEETLEDHVKRNLGR